MAPIRVLIADDHDLFREGLINLLSTQSDFTIVGEANDGVEALVKAQKLKPDLILMDIHMPACDGLEATRQILERDPEIIIVMLTASEGDKMLLEAIRLGAQGYLPKNIRSQELMNLLRGAMQGEAAITPGLAGRMLEGYRRLHQEMHEPPPPAPVELTVRESQVLNLVAQNAADQEIADALFISLNTVKTHMRNILNKLNVENRHEAVRMAQELDLL